MPRHGRLLCNLALFMVQFSASINVSLSRTAFSWFDPATQEAVAPVVFGTVRSIIALVLFAAVRFYWRWRYVGPEAHEHKNAAADLKTRGFGEQEGGEEGTFVANESIVATLAVITPVACRHSPSSHPLEDLQAKRQSYLDSTNVSASDRSRIMLLGVIGIPVNLVCFLTGVSLTDGITTGAFASTIPVCCFVIARCFGVELLSLVKVLAVACVVFGNAIMIEIWNLFVSRSDGVADRPASYYTGCFAFLGNVVAWSFYLVLQKPLLKRVHRLEFLYWFYVGGVTALIAFAVITDGETLRRQIFTPGLLSGWSWLSMCYAGFVNATLPYWLLAYGIEHGGPVLASAWNATQPVLLTIEALTFLGESLSLTKGIGGLVVLVGVSLTVVAHAQTTFHNAPIEPKMMTESPRRHSEASEDFLPLA